LCGWCALSARADGDQRVTVISDSVMTSVIWHQENMDILDQGGYQVEYDTAIGRELAGQSKVFDGTSAPTLMDLVPGIAIAPTVIVEMGYNDPAPTFSTEVEAALNLLLARGAQRIVWPTLAEKENPDYPAQNQVLYDELARYPQLSLADWVRYSAGHPDWFQNDFLHLMPAGGAGLAALLHGALAQPVCDPQRQTLPIAIAGRPYHATIQGCGGDGTGYKALSVLSGSLPGGVTVGVDGSLSGTPTAPGSFQADLAFETGNDLIGQAQVTGSVAAAPTPAPKPKPVARKRKTHRKL
jgi:hypothetical protein